MKLSELDRLRVHSLHPTLVTHVLGDEGRPDGDRLQWPAPWRGLEAYAARVRIPENAECVQVRTVLDLSALR